MVNCTTGTFALVVPRGPLLTARPLLVRGGRGRRRGSAGLLGLLHTPLLAGHRRQRQCNVRGWFCCFGTSHAVFPSFVGRSQLRGIMDDMDQNGSSLRALVFDSGSGIFRCGFAGFLRAVFLYVVVKPKMLPILAGMAQKDSYAAGVTGILAGFARCAAPRCVPFVSRLGRPTDFGHFGRKGSGRARRRQQWYVHGWFCS